MAYGDKKRKHQKMEREFSKSVGDSVLGQARAEYGRPGRPMMGAASDARKRKHAPEAKPLPPREQRPKQPISTSEAFMQFVRQPPKTAADIRKWDAEMKKYRASRGTKTTRPGR